MITHIIGRRDDLTSKGRRIADFIVEHPRRAVFMTIKELAQSCGVSQATVVRFVGKLGFSGYGEFLQALRDQVDTQLSLLDRVDFTDPPEGGQRRWQRTIAEEIDNLRILYTHLAAADLEEILEELIDSPALLVVGARLGYTLAYYMGWSLTKVRGGIRILAASDSTIIDQFTIAPASSLVIVFATSRYPNELIRAGHLARDLGHRLLVFSDSAICPLNAVAHRYVVAPLRNIPHIGSPAALSVVSNFLVNELARRYETRVKAHQERLEQAYRRQGVFFNLDRTPVSASTD